jgi:hypothetical protein
MDTPTRPLLTQIAGTLWQSPTLGSSGVASPPRVWVQTAPSGRWTPTPWRRGPLPERILNRPPGSRNRLARVGAPVVVLLSAAVPSLYVDVVQRGPNRCPPWQAACLQPVDSDVRYLCITLSNVWTTLSRARAASCRRWPPDDHDAADAARRGDTQPGDLGLFNAQRPPPCQHGNDQEEDHQAMSQARRRLVRLTARPVAARRPAVAPCGQGGLQGLLGGEPSGRLRPRRRARSARRL